MKKLLFLLIIIAGGWYLYTHYWQKATELKPKDSSSPAAGICDYQSEDAVIVTINESGPSPRCIKVKPNQYLKVQNNTEKTVRVGFENAPKTLFPSMVDIKIYSEYIFSKKFGEYLEPGVHILQASPYGGPEIWLTE